MTLIRFDNAAGRGLSGRLWGGLAEWLKGGSVLDQFSGGVEDFAPYLGDAVGMTIDGTAAVQTDEPHGVVKFSETQGADECAGFYVDENVDLDDDFVEFCLEARLKSNDDDSTTQTFVGLSDVTIGSFFGSDNTPDGSSLGVRWNGDETLDLVSIASDDTITVIDDAFATVERTVGFVKIGLHVTNLDGTNYRVVGTVASGSGTSAKVQIGQGTTSTIPTAVMKPIIIHTNDNQSAVDMEVDWRAYLNKVV